LEEVDKRRLELLFGEGATAAPSEQGFLVIDEHGDRKWGKHTAHDGGRQWLGYPSARPTADWSRLAFP
jgi:hypothetical protein